MIGGCVGVGYSGKSNLDIDLIHHSLISLASHEVQYSNAFDTRCLMKGVKHVDQVDTKLKRANAQVLDMNRKHLYMTLRSM